MMSDPTDLDTDAPAAETIDLKGALDGIDPDGTAVGWLMDPRRPEIRRRLTLYADGIAAAEGIANIARGDLAAADVGDGSYGFVIQTPARARRADRPTVIVIRDTETGQQIGTEQTLAPAPAGDATGAASQDPALTQSALPDMVPPDPALAPTPAAPVRQLYGNVDTATRDGWVTGWAWRPSDPRHRVELEILVDGVVGGRTVAETFRQDLLQGGHGDGAYGFAFALPWPVIAYKGTMAITVRDAATGEALGEPVTVRAGTEVANEDRILDLERQVRQLRDEVAALLAQAQGRHEDLSARALFRTVGAFFQELAESPNGAAFTGAGIRGALNGFVSAHPPITLARPERAPATIVVEATAPAETLYRCIAAIQSSGADARADVVLLDDGGAGGEAALLPTVVRNLRYVRVSAGTSRVAARNEAMDDMRAPIAVFCAADLVPERGWLDAIVATFDDEPQAAIVGARVCEPGGALDSAGIDVSEDLLPRPRSSGAAAGRPELSAMRVADAVADTCFAVRRDRLAELGGFADGFATAPAALLDACLALRASGYTVLYQPEAGLARPEPAGAEAPADEADSRLLRLRWPPLAVPASHGIVGHALVVDGALPRPDHDAGSVATLEQMLVLRDLGWRVAFAPTDGAFDAAGVALLRRRGIEVAAPPHTDSISTYLQRNSATLRLIHVHRYAHATMLMERARTLVPDAKIVFAPVDLHFLREQREAAVAGRAWSGTQVRADEIACVRAADATLLYSDHEVDVLAAEVGAERLHLLRWITRPVAGTPPFAARRDLCFVGGFRHPPNGDAVTWFVREILPRLRERLSGVVLHVVGSDAPAGIRDLAGPGVVVHGWVADLAAVLDTMRLSVAPLRFGAGFKGKVATSLSRGLPVVGTSIAVEGTGLSDGDGVTVADDAATFADAIVALYGDADRWAAQSQRGLDRVAALYSPEQARAIWRGLLGSLGLPAAPY